MGEKEERGGEYLVQRSGGTKGTLKGKNVWTVKKTVDDFYFFISLTQIIAGQAMGHQPRISGRKSLLSIR